MKSLSIATALLLLAPAASATTEYKPDACASLVEYITSAQATQRQLLNEYNQATVTLVQLHLSDPDDVSAEQINIPGRQARLKTYGDALSHQNDLLHHMTAICGD